MHKSCDDNFEVLYMLDFIPDLLDVLLKISPFLNIIVDTWVCLVENGIHDRLNLLDHL